MAFVDSIHFEGERTKELLPASNIKAANSTPLKSGLYNCSHSPRNSIVARERIQFQGLPARICWVGLGQRDRLGLAFNEMVRNGELKAPVVIGRDHLDSGSVASPNRETEAMLDGSDAVSDWPLLNALLSTAGGAVAFHSGAALRLLSPNRGAALASAGCARLLAGGRSDR